MANAAEEEISHNPQPAPPPGKLTKDDVLTVLLDVFRPGRGNALGTSMHIKPNSNVRPVHAQVYQVPMVKVDQVK